MAAIRSPADRQQRDDRRKDDRRKKEGTMEVPKLEKLVRLDDTSLLNWRREARTELERNPSFELQAVYDQTTAEVTQRAATAWGQR
jgi:hypothetical protein